MSLSAREKAISNKTLVCFIQGLKGNRVKIDFRDETNVCGKIESVDGYMNIEMSEVDYVAPSGETTKFSTYCCQGKFIRFVDITDEVDPMKIIKNQLEVLATSSRGRGGRGGRGRGGGRGHGRGFSSGGRGGYGGSSGGYGGHSSRY